MSTFDTSVQIAIGEQDWVGISSAPPAPIVTSVVPGSGTDAGGTSVTVHGNHFHDADSVKFDGDTASDFAVVDNFTITCTTPPGTAGLVTVAVHSPAGIGELDVAFEFIGD